MGSAQCSNFLQEHLFCGWAGGQTDGLQKAKKGNSLFLSFKYGMSTNKMVLILNMVSKVVKDFFNVVKNLVPNLGVRVLHF